FRRLLFRSWPKFPSIWRKGRVTPPIIPCGENCACAGLSSGTAAASKPATMAARARMAVLQGHFHLNGAETVRLTQQADPPGSSIRDGLKARLSRLLSCQLSRQLPGLGELRPAFRLPDFFHFVLDVLREHVFRRPLAIERDLGRHFALGARSTQPDRQCCERVSDGVVDSRGLVAGVHHAVGALLVIAGAI